MKRYYIAYGSNLNVKQMGFRCSDASIVGTGFIPNYELLFKGSKTGSYLTIEPAEGKEVPFVLWSVSERDELSLDRYEGYPTFYYKKEMEVDVVGISSGKHYHKKAFVYIMHEERELGIPTRQYLMVCKEGYDAFKFDDEYLKEAFLKSWR